MIADDVLHVLHLKGGQMRGQDEMATNDEGRSLPRSHLYITHVVRGAPTTISRATEPLPAPWPHFSRLVFAKPNAGTASVGIDELDARGFEGTPDNFLRRATWLT
jgi:hypothetical protein